MRQAMVPVFNGLVYLHGRDILHRDLKASHGSRVGPCLASKRGISFATRLTQRWLQELAPLRLSPPRPTVLPHTSCS